MAIKSKDVKRQYHKISYTIVTAILLCSIFLSMIAFLYNDAEAEAYENLHIQTKQIKDDITLQLISDRENLTTMANFASKLYKDGEDYDLMFESFKAIGLIENIGILNPDNTFSTRAGSIDLDGKIEFSEEAKKGVYISGRINDLTRDNYQIIRSAVPIVVDGQTVGMLYGVIKLDKIGERYNAMAKELDAQLFVYDKEDGNLVVDTIHQELGNISFLKDRKYNDGYSYEEMASSDKGFTSFASAYKDENMHMHYSVIEDIGWMIALARYDSQVFALTKKLTLTLFLVFFVMLVVIVVYVVMMMMNERKLNEVTNCASEVRRILLETSGDKNNIGEALKQVSEFAKSRSALFFDAENEESAYSRHDNKDVIGFKKDREYFKAEVFRYAAEIYKLNETTFNMVTLRANKKLQKTNLEFYDFLKKYNIDLIAFSATVDNNNHAAILAVVNPKNKNAALKLEEKIAACFSMAMYNKSHLNKTQLAATTDSLTGTMNRVAYKSDLLIFDREKPLDFSCLYIDVNELHFINNKYGHAAGDEMLLYIANTLKEVFYGHKVYRMGGDEFLVFCQNTDTKLVKKGIEVFVEQLKLRDYNVAIGMSFRSQNTNTEEMVKEAEVRMYEAKSLYYQNKEEKNIALEKEKEYVQVKTGISEIDTMLSVLKEHYNGIYRVSLDNDTARRILMPAYLKYNENEEHFSDLFAKYVTESVDAQYRRAVMNFFNYEALKRQLFEGKIPKITYKKNNGESVVLSVYRLDDSNIHNLDTLWVFAKAQVTL